MREVEHVKVVIHVMDVLLEEVAMQVLVVHVPVFHPEIANSTKHGR